MAAELEPNEINRVAPLFDSFVYDLAWRDSALYDQEARLFVDDRANPALALLCHRIGDCVIAGRPDLTALGALIEYVFTLQNPPPVVFFIPPSDDWVEPIMAQAGGRFEVIQRVDFTFTDAQVANIRQWRDNVPAGYELKRIDLALAQRINDELDHEFNLFWDSNEVFLRDGLGFCLVRGEKLASVAYAAFKPRRRLEFAVATAPEYRGRGFVSLTSMPLIEYCLDNGIEPHWSTETRNEPSRKAAYKLGFANEQFHNWLKHLESHD